MRDTPADEPVELDDHRGMAAQKDTDTRRDLQAVQADQAALRDRREELEYFLFAGAATSWGETAAKARYLLELFAASPDAQDPRRRRLIVSTLDYLERFSAGISGKPAHATGRSMLAWFVPPIVIPIGLALAIMGYAGFVYFN